METFMDNSAGAKSQRPCVVIVEDDDAARRSLQLLLRSHGYDVRAFASPKAVLADAHSRGAACLIADLIMPELDGIELLNELYASGCDCPAVLVSGFLTGEREERALQAGFKAILAKPFNRGELMQAVRMVTGSTRH